MKKINSQWNNVLLPILRGRFFELVMYMFTFTFTIFFGLTSVHGGGGRIIFQTRSGRDPPKGDRGYPPGGPKKYGFFSH